MYDAIERLRPDAVLHLGDHLEDAESMESVFSGVDFYHVPGNCDYFTNVPPSLTISLDGVRIFLTHGHLWNPEKLPPVPPDSVFAFGHIHLPVLRKEKSGLTVFNPGSISLPKGGNPPSFGFYRDHALRILNLENGEEMASLSL